MAARIEEATEVDDAMVTAFVTLTPQLSSSSPPPTAEQLQEIVDDPGSTLFLAREEDGTVVGTLTLATFRIPTGMRAWIEDVIVDKGASGQQLGERLTRAALDKARALGCKTVDLTSRPSREAANHIYKKLGFEPRETNVYRYTL
ncbi:MAG TPA: GNAT family N-acetyltransferase [Acidimicrobiales bacterium]|jgi:ribosomal protein S18 acetylase RimI-like enzyme|nr:GNAT family N-acetyltransferase [Acidimicrobiales bacterium]